jgi:uncharacterized membrane protein
VINNIIAAPQPMMVTGGCNHILHLLLTMFTCGIWLPIWIICAIVQQPKVYGSAQQPTRRTNPLPVVGVIGGVIPLAVTVTYPMTGFWIIFVGLLLAGAGYLGYMAYQREVKRRAEQAEIAGRADAQNRQYLSGDQSGLYGDYNPPTDLRNTDWWRKGL